MPTRPDIQAIEANSSSSVIIQHAQAAKLFPLLAQLSFHVIPAKLDGELGNVYSWIEELGGRCVGVNQGGYVVTALKGRMRLEKILGRSCMVGDMYERLIRDIKKDRIDGIRSCGISSCSGGFDEDGSDSTFITLIQGLPSRTAAQAHSANLYRFIR